MPNLIKLVAGDTRPRLRVYLTDANTGEAANITGCTLSMSFYPRGTGVALFYCPAYVVDGAAGTAEVVWPIGALNVEEGYYCGDIKATWPDGSQQTTFDSLNFLVRAAVQAP